MTEERMNVSMAFDEKYAKYAYTTILSLFENNNSAEIVLYILQRDLSESSKNNIVNLCDKYSNSVLFLNIDVAAIENMLPTTAWWPIEVYFRLNLIELLPKDVDRILYLDGDMIVNKDLSELYCTDIDGYDLAASYDVCLEDASLEDFLTHRNSLLEELYIDKTYINSGMLLLNIKRMRSLYTFSDYMEALKKLEFKVRTPDQDLINLLHRGLIRHLDPRRYNYPGYKVYYEVGDYRTAKESIEIIHFIGLKPWQGGNHIHYSTERIWWEYAIKTPYASELMENYIFESVTDKTVEDRVRVEKNAKDILENENKALRKELFEAMNSLKNTIEMFANRQ